MMKNVLAFDFGASGGRAILGCYDGQTIRLQEVHRFSNDPVTVRGTMYWDALRLFHEIKRGIRMAKEYAAVESIGVDTWGVDFGLLDAGGTLLENPVHYRDKRTRGMLKAAWERIDRNTFYERTGNQFMEINTAFQLLSLARRRPDVLDRAHTLLMMPDLFNYWLSGEKRTEYSIASTTQLLDARARDWSAESIAALGLPRRIFTDIVPTGTPVGRLSEELAEELGVARAKIIAVAGHDTQCAMAAVPTPHDDFIFLSCGTWSLLGTELPRPLINERSLSCNLTNEGGYDGKISFLKNIVGLWLIQECRRQWIREGMEYSFGALEQMASEAAPFRSLIDPDAPEFMAEGNIPARIRAFCQRTNQPVPETTAEIVRCIDESLAFKYRASLEQLCSCTDTVRDADIHMIGGGVQSRLLCQCTANACGRTVQAGPVEATVMGNVVLQLLADAALGSLKEARSVVAASCTVMKYVPQDGAWWNEAYGRWKEITAC
jgi:rhamnulokinase